MRSIFLLPVLLFSFNAHAQTSTKPAPFTEGVLVSRATFPGHALHDQLKTVSFEKGESDERNKIIQSLKEHQSSIVAQDEQGVKDAFFVSAIMIMPVHTELYQTPSKQFIRTFAIGYHQENLINRSERSAKMVMSDRENTTAVTINSHTDELKEIWQKYQIDAAQYNAQRTNETAVIAGYNCKKIIYTFGGTSRGTGVQTMVINMLPEKVIAWYTDDLDPSINQMHFIDFEMKKAVLKYEAHYDKIGKNKMLVEVKKVEPKKIEEEIFDLKTILPEVQHTKGSYEGGTKIIEIVAAALSLLMK